MKVKRYLNRKRELEVTRQPESRLKVILQYSAVLLTLLIGMFYYFGYLYLSTWLGYWGISPNMFPISKEEIIIAGGEQVTLSFINTLTSNLLVLLGLLLLFLGVFVLSAIRKLRAKFKNRLLSLIFRIRWLRQYVEVSDNHDRAITFLGYVDFAILVVMTLILIVAFLGQGIAMRAKEDCKKVRDNIISVKPTVPKAVLIIRNGAKGFENYSGYLIHTSGNHCVLYDKGNRTIILPIANMVRMEIEDKKNMP